MSDFKTKLKLPQVSKYSHTDLSVCPKDSGGDTNLTRVCLQKSTVLKIATFNTRTLLSEESFTEMEKELEKIRWDIVGMSEVRRRGEGLETLKYLVICFTIMENNTSQ